MTSLVRKVLRSGSSKKLKRDTLSPPNPTAPRPPPSPDLSELTSQEIVVLKEVFRRQEQFENEEINRQAKLKEGLVSFEESVKHQASQKSKLKHVDLRLCRLCFKTKFADGIGRVCSDCHKRVCNKCGAFSSPKWNAKKHKCSKSKWRCNMCQMKREALAKTGIWYHGSMGESSNPSTRLRQKVWSSDLESSDTESCNQIIGLVRAVYHDSQPDEYHESESPQSTDQSAARRMEFRRTRRRSLTSKSSVDGPDDDELYIDNEEFLRERHMCRIERHSKKWRRRHRSNTSLTSSERETHDLEWGIERGTDSDAVKTPDRTSATEHESSADTWLSSDRDSNAYDAVSHRNQCKSTTNKHHRPSFLSRDTGSRCNQTGEATRDGDSGYRERSESKIVPFHNEHTDGENTSQSRVSTVAGFSHRHEHLSDSERRYEDGVPRALNHYVDRSRQFEEKYPQLQRPNNRANSLGKLMKHDKFHNSASNLLAGKRWEYMDISVESPNGSRSLVNQINNEETDAADGKPSPHKHKLLQGSVNSLSPDRALSISQRQGHGLADKNPGRRSVSPKTSTTVSRTSPHILDTSQFAKGRRMTIPHCQNIEILSVGGLRRDSIDTAKPHEILLHRDKDDTSQRTIGLGMRVVGGKCGVDGNLGAYVTMVTKGGPAATQGISLGDQIMEWNGRSMVDVTFEEAQEVIRQSGNIIQLTVNHINNDNPVNTSPISQRRQPMIVRSGTLNDELAESPEIIESTQLRKPKRRLLPKTPLEIKRDVKTISGTLLMQIDYDVKCHCLLVVLLRGSNIHTAGDNDRPGPNPVAMVHLLPNRLRFEPKESEIKFNSVDPDWNDTFIFPNVTEDEIGDLSLEVTLWDYKPMEDEFLGEVLLDLGEAKIDNTPTYYQLEDHDDNSSPLPFRKKSFSMSESSAISPVTSFDASSTVASRNPSPRSSVSVKVMERVLPISPAFEKMKEWTNYGKRSPIQIAGCNMPELQVGIPYVRSRSLNACTGRDRTDSSAQSTPLHSPQTPKDEAFPKFDSFKSKLKRKMRTIGKISSSFALHTRKDSTEKDVPLNRSHSLTDMSSRRMLTAPEQKPPRRSFEQIGLRYDLLAPPHPLNRPNNTEEFFTEQDQDKDILKNTRPDRAEPDGDDITSLLGPGQVAPKPNLETNVCGDIKVGFMVSKGQLEIDVIVVKGLIKSGLSCPPDTYVKTYLVEGSKTVQKKKTQTVRSSFDPIFRKKIKYSACNIHGRCIKINVWEKQKTFDKKQCLGEAVVTLDSLDLVQHTLEWYKLFPTGATDLGSIESLNYW